MKRAFLVISVCLLCSCGTCDNFAKDMDSEFGGLDRRVTLYAADGSSIGVWEGDIYVEEEETDGLSFLLNGERVIINGTYLIEEI